MKSLSIKIPLSIASSMDDKARLNPSWIAGFLIVNKNKPIDDERVKGLTYNYTFKVEDELHKHVKLLAIEHGLPLNEFVARLLVKYYK